MSPENAAMTYIDLSFVCTEVCQNKTKPTKLITLKLMIPRILQLVTKVLKHQGAF